MLFLLYGHSLGRAFSKNRGNTGAPGDETLGNGTPKTCVSCHSSDQEMSVELELEALYFGQTITSYAPDQEYSIHLTVHTLEGDPVRYGYQLIALEDSTGTAADEWSNPSNNTRIAYASSTDRRYAEHLIPSVDSVFTVNWTAPPAGSGPVTFYASGNGVNYSVTTAGDAADNVQLTLQEGDPVSVSVFHELEELVLYPNPISDLINIECMSCLEGDIAIDLLNAQGKKVIETKEIINTKFSIPVPDIEMGMYYLWLRSNNQSIVRKIIIRR